MKRKYKYVKSYCNWEYEKGGNVNAPCRKKEYRKGFCKQHYNEKFRVTIPVCMNSKCERGVDDYGDFFCELHGAENGRPKCEKCESCVWRKGCDFCKKHDPIFKCCRVSCKNRATKDHEGFRYCITHYPNRKICKHVYDDPTKTCRQYVSKESDFCNTHKPNKKPRRTCNHVLTNGGICSQPAMKKSEYCRRHI